MYYTAWKDKTKRPTMGKRTNQNAQRDEWRKEKKKKRTGAFLNWGKAEESVKLWCRTDAVDSDDCKGLIGLEKNENTSALIKTYLMASKGRKHRKGFITVGPGNKILWRTTTVEQSVSVDQRKCWQQIKFPVAYITCVTICWNCVGLKFRIKQIVWQNNIIRTGWYTCEWRHQ